MIDLTVAAIPFFFGSMGAEAAYQRRRRELTGVPTAGDYERNDTITSLTMGTLSLAMPFVATPLFRRFDVLDGRYRRIVLGIVGGAAVATVAADAIARARELEAGVVDDPQPSRDGARRSATADVPSTDQQPTRDAAVLPSDGSRRPRRSGWRRFAGRSSVVAIAGVAAAAAGTWSARTTGKRLFRHRVLPDLGTGLGATIAAVAAWDFIYYWNHRFMHSSRYLWALHVVHHSSERYNLSTALRQSVGDALGMFVPYGAMSLLGLRPEMVERARGINLIYQYWIHTETIPKLGPLEKVLNTASHHRVHHGSNRRYLDRNHGSILIIWDRMFATFEEEDDDEPVVYGLTKNIDTFNPLRVATHELVDIATDVAGSDTWSDRLSYVLRGPGWAYERHRELGTVDAHRSEEAAPIAG